MDAPRPTTLADFFRIMSATVAVSVAFLAAGYVLRQCPAEAPEAVVGVLRKKIPNMPVVRQGTTILGKVLGTVFGNRRSLNRERSNENPRKHFQVNQGVAVSPVPTQGSAKGSVAQGASSDALGTNYAPSTGLNEAYPEVYDENGKVKNNNSASWMTNDGPTVENFYLYQPLPNYTDSYEDDMNTLKNAYGDKYVPEAVDPVIQRYLDDLETQDKDFRNEILELDTVQDEMYVPWVVDADAPVPTNMPWQTNPDNPSPPVVTDVPWQTSVEKITVETEDTLFNQSLSAKRRKAKQAKAAAPKGGKRTRFPVIVTQKGNRVDFLRGQP